MAILTHEIQINVPAEKLWNILSDLEQVGNYNPLVDSVKYISNNKTGVGASRQCQFKPKGYAKERVTAMQQMESISMEMYESEWPLRHMRWTNYLKTENGHTVLKTITDYKVKFGLLGALMDRVVMKPKFNKILDELFISLKQYAEKQYAEKQ